jgi:hypothetical protein
VYREEYVTHIEIGVNSEINSNISLTQVHSLVISLYLEFYAQCCIMKVRLIEIMAHNPIYVSLLGH